MEIMLCWKETGNKQIIKKVHTHSLWLECLLRVEALYILLLIQIGTSIAFL